MALHATYAYVLTLGVLPFSYSAPKNRASGCVRIKSKQRPQSPREMFRPIFLPRSLHITPDRDMYDAATAAGEICST